MRGYQHPDLVALDEIEDLLEAYAEARLAPTGPVLARMRRNVLLEAAAAAATRAVEGRVGDTDVTPARRRFAFPTLTLPRAMRPLVALGMAVAIGGGTSAAVLAAPAGSPFFNARVALEEFFLPAPAQAGDRLAAHEQHLQDRLAEAEAAAARGDATALAAALAAYDREVAQALNDVGADKDLLAHLEAMLARHVGLLTALEVEVPEQGSVDKALENSQKAIVKIREKNQGGRPSQAPGGRPDDPGGPAPDGGPRN